MMDFAAVLAAAEPSEASADSTEQQCAAMTAFNNNQTKRNST
jgi:hypothetical protein